VAIDTGGERLHFFRQPGQRCGVAFGQLPDAAGQRLADAIQFALDAGVQGAQPLVLHHQGLDLGRGELGELGGHPVG
jgi:hypothetical protein